LGRIQLALLFAGGLRYGGGASRLLILILSSAAGRQPPFRRHFAPQNCAFLCNFLKNFFFFIYL
jgi:hypothetical protein